MTSLSRQNLVGFSALLLLLLPVKISAQGTWVVTGAPPPGTAGINHTATLLPSGKILVAGGCCSLGNGALSGAALYDPASGTFAATGSLTTPRYDHTATLLRTGKVLIAGGYSPENLSKNLTSCELYDPATGTFTSTGSLTQARGQHTATLLPSGQVLMVGGRRYPNYASTAELYDPFTGLFTNTSSPVFLRAEHTATLLSTGKVLVVGGATSVVVDTVELYDPLSGLFTWVWNGGLLAPRAGHTATLLSTGKVLVVGGYGNGTLPASAEVYDPAIGAWVNMGLASTPRCNHGATLLPSGQVLVAGGIGAGGVLSSGALYDVEQGTVTAVGLLSTPRFNHTVTLLPTGCVLAVGGAGPSYSPLGTAELFANAESGWTPAGSLQIPRYWHTATLLPSGKVLVAGGSNRGARLSTSELYDRASGAFAATGSLATGRANHTATLLPSGKVLVAGGYGSAASLGSAELYDPTSGSFSATGSLTTGRSNHTATLLRSGKVLITGGSDAGSAAVISSCELYDPAAGTFSATGSLSRARYWHTATLLPSGKVLIAGGLDSVGTGSYLKNAELYDPATGAFSVTGSLVTGRAYHTASPLPSGKVLIVGHGYGWGIPFEGELYDPTSETFATIGPVANSALIGHTATFLPSGHILVAGGGELSASSGCEIFRPEGSDFAGTTPLQAPRIWHTATLLPSGEVLVVGGGDSTGAALASSELYTEGGSCTPASLLPAGQPQTVTIPSGQSTNLAVTPAGTAPFSYQWFEGVSGDTARPVGTSSGTFSTGPLTRTGGYWVRVTNACGSADSQTAVVIIPCQVPAGSDTDCDGIPDAREADLVEMGASSIHQDVFLELDYMVEPGFFLGLGGHTHQAKTDAMELVTAAFRDAPTVNPDGTTGITLHVDCGPDCEMTPVLTWGARSQANALREDEELGTTSPPGVNGCPPDREDDCYFWTEFNAIRDRIRDDGRLNADQTNQNFSPTRSGLFHYGILGHALGGSYYCNSGIANLSAACGGPLGAGATRLIVALGERGPFRCDLFSVPPRESVAEQAGTVMHELGHNLGLLHGGGDDVKQKPNYISVMNYAFQFSGVGCSGTRVDYSRAGLDTLYETGLSEQSGLGAGVYLLAPDTCTGYQCGRVGQACGVGSTWVPLQSPLTPINWNCNGLVTDTNVAADINGDGGCDELVGYNDWASVTLSASGGPCLRVLAASEPDAVPAEDIQVQREMTPREAAKFNVPYAVSIAGPSSLAAQPGSAFTPTITVRNAGTAADTYTITASSSSGWADVSGVPASVSVGGGQSVSVPLPISVPTGAMPPASEVVTVRAESQGAPGVLDVLHLTVGVTLVPAPSIAGISPIVGSPGGGTTVTITGAGFQTGASASIGGTELTNVQVVNASSLVGMTGPHLPAALDVVVTNPDRLSARLVSGFNVGSFGELNGDGKVDVFDLVILANYIVGNVVPGVPPLMTPAVFADLNSDGGVNVFDLVLLANKIVGNP